jgi:hypothetical protein
VAPAAPSRSGAAAVAPDQSRQKAKVEEKKSAKNLSAAPHGKKSANTATAPSALSNRARESFGMGCPLSGRRMWVDARSSWLSLMR